MKKIINKESGFTLIEVVLVLAIGALIILMALLAFGGASRSRRDTARQDAVGKIAAAVEQYAANNGGTYPKDTTELQAATGNITEPLSNSKPTFQAGDSDSSSKIYFSTGQTCNVTTGKVAAATGTGTYAISYKQEGGGGKVACKDNQN